MLSLFVKLHETGYGSLRGIRKKVTLTLKVNNTNPSNYYNDFGVGKRLHPVWFSEKHTKWGEDGLASLESLDPFLNQDQASLSISMTIIKSEVDTIPTVIGPGLSPFADYADSSEFSDIRFRIKPTGTLFYGHKVILSAMSPWFKSLFTSGMRESFESIIDIDCVDPNIFSRLLHYCYTFSLDIQSVEDARNILEAADRFQLSRLRDEALRYMRQEITESNIWDIWAWSDIYDCDRTRSACFQFVSNHFVELVKNPAWLRAKSNVLKMALQIDEGMLPCEESLYESVVSWAKYGKMNNPAFLLVDDENDHNAKEQVEETSVGNTFGVDQKHHDEDNRKNENENDNSQAMIQSDNDNDDDNENGLSFEDELNDRQGDLAEILQYIRFPLIPPSFLVNVVEKDSFVMNLPGVRDLLFEAYRHHAMGDLVGILDNVSFRCKPRHIKTNE
ncbi:hypothetical protein INT45_003611 [Circinella minor]|uniref:BTB domain-containing protein n=1 Tax=Circinella minor TaxID=1195481 RepID=A0A8H7RWM2_9FUNG|nr:hypothetical protein INT45_003611 [Circinella minor]